MFANHNNISQDTSPLKNIQNNNDIISTEETKLTTLSYPQTIIVRYPGKKMFRKKTMTMTLMFNLATETVYIRHKKKIPKEGRQYLQEIFAEEIWKKSNSFEQMKEMKSPRKATSQQYKILKKLRIVIILIGNLKRS